MTRHTYRPGDAIDPGATYYPMDGARQRDPLEPDDVIAALDAWENAKPLSDAIDAARQALDGRCSCTTEECRCQPKAEHWSPWLEWRGGPCPLPPVVIEIEGEPPYVSQASNWERPFRFRYVAKDPAGWLPRGDWIPPAELWAPECPVRCEWTAKESPSKNWRGRFEHIPPETWGYITHIRLVAREAKAGLPEGFGIDEEGALWSTYGPAFSRHDFEHHGPAAIRQAVKAWLREMGDE